MALGKLPPGILPMMTCTWQGTQAAVLCRRLVEALEDMDGAGMDEYSDMSTADTALLQDPKGHHRRVSSSSSSRSIPHGNQAAVQGVAAWLP